MCDHFQAVLERRADDLIVGLPPHGELNRIDDFKVLNDGMGNYWAEWTYRNAGDCDENGRVGIYDLTSVEDDLGKTRDDEDWEYAKSCAGNRGGVIDLEDVAVIANNYGNRIEFYRVVSSFDPPSQTNQETSNYVSTLSRLPLLSSWCPQASMSLPL